MSIRIPLGPFDLLEPVGRGGMGVVWRAVHRRQQVPVAIKVLSATADLDDKALLQFRNEVRAVASLTHPGIVMVLDHGEVDARAERQSEGQLVAGSPFLAMELASGGSLSGVEAPIPWADLRRVMLSLLDALAHAHARGVIHRDLKPGNVLICTGEDLSPGLKLSDFGIATAIDWHVKSGSFVQVAGTLHYMSPEQVLGHHHDYGPWTDLYSLGVMAWRMACGQLPFAGKKGPALMKAQLMEKLPPLAPRLPVPSGFEDWIRKLVKKPRGGRFQCAADAAEVLVGLGDVDDGDPPSVLFRAGRGDGPTRSPSTTANRRKFGTIPEVNTLLLRGDSTEEFEDTDVDPDATSIIRINGAALKGRTRRPVPKSWRRQIPPSPPLQLVGAGLGLYSVRQTPFVGRERERDLIWTALRQVDQEGEPQVLLVTGTAGVGKSRLVEWVGERAQELGAAVCVKANPPEPGADVTATLRAMVGRHLRTLKLERDVVQERAEDFVGAPDTQRILSLVEYLKPATPLERRAMPFLPVLDNPEARYAVVRQFFERLADDRSVVVWLEDVHLNTEALGLVAHLLRSRGNQRLPVLILATLKDEALNERVAAAARVEALLKLPGCRKLPLRPLSPSEHHELVQSLLGMEGTLSAQVEERTRGNALFAVQLIGDWVQRGLLEVGPAGFELAGAQGETPVEFLAPHQEAVAKVLDGLPADAEVYLERAAVLGLEVSSREWTEVCRVYAKGERAGARAEVLERLRARKLVSLQDEGFVFENALTREALLKRSRDGGRLSGHHLACALMLEAEIRAGARGLSSRLGGHLLEAGEATEAIGWLLDGAPEERQRRGPRAALDVLARAEAALNATQVPLTDPQWGRLWLRKARLFRDLLRYDEALRWAGKALYSARRQGWTALVGEAVDEQGLGWIGVNRLDQAQALYADLEVSATVTNSVLDQARASHGLGLIAGENRQLELSESYFLKAIQLFKRAQRPVERAWSQRGLAVYVYLDERGDELLREAQKVFEAQGARAEAASCWNGLAESARRRGKLEEAEHDYRRAIEGKEASGGEGAVERLNLALVQLKRGRFEEAHGVAEGVRQAMERANRRPLLLAAHAAILPAVAHGQDWGAWDHHLHQIKGLLDETRFNDPDLAWTIQLGGEEAARGGQPERAEGAFHLALKLWNELGEVAAAKAVQQLLLMTL